MATIMYGIGVSGKSKKITITVKTSSDKKGNAASTLLTKFSLWVLGLVKLESIGELEPRLGL